MSSTDSTARRDVERTIRREITDWAEREFNEGLRHAETHCWRCKAEHEEGATHCPECGTDLIPF